MYLIFHFVSFIDMTVYVDKRISYGAFKNCLVPYVGVSSDLFRVSMFLNSVMVELNLSLSMPILMLIWGEGGCILHLLHLCMCNHSEINLVSVTGQVFFPQYALS